MSNDHVEEMRLPGKSQNVLPQVLKQICGTRDYARVRFTGDPLELKIY